MLRRPPAGRYLKTLYAVEANPWPQKEDIESALFFRGVVVSAYGSIETRLAELAIRISRLHCYASLKSEFPYKSENRLKYLREAFSFGPLKPYEKTAEQFCKRFENSAELRHLIAHAWMQVLPEWGIIMKDFKVEKGGIITQRHRRFSLETLELFAYRTARLSRLAQMLSDRLNATDILPPMID
jgi:hypothetical protein